MGTVLLCVYFLSLPLAGKFFYPTLAGLLADPAPSRGLVPAPLRGGLPAPLRELLSDPAPLRELPFSLRRGAFPVLMRGGFRPPLASSLPSYPLSEPIMMPELKLRLISGKAKNSGTIATRIAAIEMVLDEMRSICSGGMPSVSVELLMTCRR